MIILQRLPETDTATFGHLLDASGEVLGCTLELPDRGNAPMVSRIPAGTYPIALEYSEKFGRDLWELKDVPGRAEVKIHNGNLPKHTDGCILIGTNFGDVDGERGVVNSRVALNAFMLRMAAEGIVADVLEVRDVQPGEGAP